MNLQLALNLAYNQLNTVAQSPEYWTILNSIFGTNYNSVLAQTLQQEWQAGNFSTLPPIEILNSSILDKANGAYFSFGVANPDGAAHLRSFGNNTFGFEDLPAGVGVSDYDFNDAVFSFGAVV
ncbi:MAG: DUF4114 domain-containing protein [Dolichospermum sp. DET69]|nr:MAG: DUF4114 domain-containing protein [Dolichospermum sp. DET69]